MSVQCQVLATHKPPAWISPAASPACATMATVEMEWPVQVKPSVCSQALNTHVWTQHMCLTVYAHVNSYEHDVPRRNIIVRRWDQGIYMSCQPPLCASCFYLPRCSLSLSDINECTVPSTCHAQAACTNTPPGSFTCACNPGYSGDGMSCTGKTECIYIHAHVNSCKHYNN